MSAESKAAKEQGVCFDWLKGKCKRGDQCKYKHEKPTLPAAPSPSPRQRSKTMCKFYLKGTCNNCLKDLTVHSLTRSIGRHREMEERGHQKGKDLATEKGLAREKDLEIEKDQVAETEVPTGK
eukprot:2745135-Amphidinium_carterae.1